MKRGEDSGFAGNFQEDFNSMERTGIELQGGNSWGGKDLIRGGGGLLKFEIEVRGGGKVM